ncbi:uncharacterized protein SPPG_01996 [Spizellomyces punctatus DAOM BR117]|uniref:Nitrogen permease regulator 3 n=1 Tax=Spizellomyces punctatus (strain DAOM BR117) TaxID=645134 RepID=A0A0L0HPM1_SPIPD|nr:uncharacterized protein SPPG_01996 [Spizellomyces punctatus DAOM BR117]KND02915.1 hypothetical protein SPPG_01996 [Spizellomyces punctatus DAOM BR117]|eukprot:XP_016610954.1 hypothetical protein SPPG_01996 [Spizellomyces punctatus DAOM BR117]
MSSSVLGILLICYSSRGHQLVFSYPSDPKRVRGTSRDEQRSRLPRNLPGSSVGQPNEVPEVRDGAGRDTLREGISQRPSTADLERAKACLRPDAEKFLGFDTHFLSDILSPKVALCDRQFQLTVDDVTFIGHPTLLHADRPGTGHRFARMIQKKRLAAHMGAAAPTSTNLQESVAPGVTITPSLSDRSSSDPFLKSANSPVNIASAHQLSMFNLVFAMQPDRGQCQVDTMYKHVISKITAALKYEQLKRGYIRKEAELILSIKDEAQVKSLERVRLSDVMDQVLAESTLARCLAHIYNSITNDSVAHVVVNSSVDLSLHIPDRVSRPLALTESTTLARPKYAFGSEDTGSPILRPYHALLLLYDPEEILKALPLDPSPLLVELIQIVTPTQCFEELQTTLDCSLSQLYRLAAHLVHWQKAKIIDVISIRNVYVVSQGAELDLLPRLVQDFNSRFPQLDLPTILSDLSIPRPYSAIIPQKEFRTLYLEVLTFLLRYNLVTQLHMYIYLMIPEHICGKTVMGGEAEAPGPPAVFIPDPARATEVEREWINKLAYEHPPAIGSLFLRLAPYFSGKYHVEEIVFRENLTKKDLRTILSRFREVVVSALLP